MTLRRTSIFTLLLLTVITTCAQAQTVPAMRSPLKPITDRIQPWDCELPAVPGMQRQRVNTTPGALVEWCVTAMGVGVAAARAAPWTAAVDGGVKSALAVACRTPATVDEAILCYAVLPAAATSAMQLMGNHTLEIASIAINEGVPLTHLMEHPDCVMDGVHYDLGTPLPNTAAGIALGNLFTTTIGSFTAESRIGRLRQDGWHVEWTWVQWKAFVSAADRGGGSVVFGWCDGERWP